jgi:hypothetical protein
VALHAPVRLGVPQFGTAFFLAALNKNPPLNAGGYHTKQLAWQSRFLNKRCRWLPNGGNITFAFMPYGFFTVEQWKPARRSAAPEWAALRHFDARHTLNQVMSWIGARGKPGFYRAVQMQRMIWAEKSEGKLRLKKWHAGSPESLERTAAAYTSDRGKYPTAPRSCRKKS